MKMKGHGLGGGAGAEGGGYLWQDQDIPFNQLKTYTGIPFCIDIGINPGMLLEHSFMFHRKLLNMLTYVNKSIDIMSLEEKKK